MHQSYTNMHGSPTPGSCPQLSSGPLQAVGILSSMCFLLSFLPHLKAFQAVLSGCCGLPQWCSP